MVRGLPQGPSTPKNTSQDQNQGSSGYHLHTLTGGRFQGSLEAEVKNSSLLVGFQA